MSSGARWSGSYRLPASYSKSETNKLEGIVCVYVFVSLFVGYYMLAVCDLCETGFENFHCYFKRGI